MTDEQIKEAARRLEVIDYHERAIADLRTTIAGHEREIQKERRMIDSLRSRTVFVPQTPDIERSSDADGVTVIR